MVNRGQSFVLMSEDFLHTAKCFNTSSLSPLPAHDIATPSPSPVGTLEVDFLCLLSNLL